MAPKPINVPIPPDDTTAPKKQSNFLKGITTPATTPTTTTTVPTTQTTQPNRVSNFLTLVPGGTQPTRTTTATGTQEIDRLDAITRAQASRLDASIAGVPEQKLEDVDKGIIGGIFGAANSLLNFKIPGTSIRPVYLPFYPVDKVLEIEQFIPGIINQIQNATEGKAVDVGSFTDPFGDKGFVTEVGRAISNAPRKTELFQGAQEQRGYRQVVDDPKLAFALDIFAMPTTYFTGGGTGIGKGFLKKLAAGGIKKSITEAGEALTKAGAKKLAAEEALRIAKAEADDIARKAAENLVGQDAVRAATTNVAKAESKLAKANKATALEEANPEILLKNAEDYARTAAPRRVYGARSREELAATVVEVAEIAAKTLDDVASGAVKLDPQSLKRVQALDNLLNKTPGALDQIITKGYGGIRGPATDILYTKGGFRLGVGKLKTPVFGEVVSNILGTGASRLRVGTGRALTGARGVEGLFELGFARSEAGKALTEWATPLGKKGIAGEADIRGLRSQLRSGQLTGDAAKQAVRVLSVDRVYRQALAEVTQQLDWIASPAFSRTADRVFVRTVEDLIVDPRINLFDTVRGGVNVAADTAESASRKIGRQISQQEFEFAQRYKTSLNGLYDAADDVYKEVQLLAGVPVERLQSLPKNENFFPHVLSDKAKDFLRRTGSKEYDELMGFDRTLLGQLSTPRRLVPGSKVGTYTLTATDVAGGTKRLNEIIRQQKGIDFDWFAVDAGEAMANQVDNIASDIAFLTTIKKELQGKGPGVIRAGELLEYADAPFVGTLVADVEAALSPAAIAKINTIPEATAVLDNVVAELSDLKATVAIGDTPLLSADIENSIQNIQAATRALGELADTVPPTIGGVITAEAMALSDLVAAEARGTLGAITARPISDFTRVKTIVDDGFAELNRKILPGVQARGELTALVQNVRRMEDPAFLRAFNKYLGWYNRTFKGWVTATPGFHVRNAYSNAFFMAAAGADMRNVLEAGDIYDKYLKFIRAGRKEGAEVALEGVPLTPYVIDEFVSKAFPDASPGRVQAITTALENVGVAGFGRVEEVFEGAGRGFRGLGVTGGTAANRASEIIGTPLTVSRQAGQTIENYTRFALTYDGIAKGLSAEQAAARTAKYLIDYSDISRADQVLKQIIPFWMWMSRATPLMVEILTTNPKAYALYKKVTNALRDEEGESDYVPVWMQTSGAFKAPFNLGGSSYLMPDIGLTGLSEDIGAFTSPAGVLAALNPVIKSPLEVWLNYDAFRKEQIANKEFDPEADAKLRKYLAKNFTILGPVMQRYGRAGAAAAELVNADSVAEFIRDATRTGTPAFLQETQGITEPTQSQNVTTLSSFVGIPIRNLEPYQETNEAKRRADEYELLTRLEQIKRGER